MSAYALESLEALVERARADGAPLKVRQEAFARLVERFQDAVYGHACALLRDTDLAQDAAQETFLTAYASLTQLRTPNAFPGWLRSITRTQCVRLRRKHALSLGSSEELDSIEVGSAAACGLAQRGPDPMIVAEARELQATLAGVLQTLPATERTVTVLFYLSGYPQREIAQFLGVPITTVKKRLQSARKRLQQEMAAMKDDAVRGHGREHSPCRDERLLEAVLYLTSFEATTAEGEQPVLELLLVDGLKVNARDPTGRTLFPGRHSVDNPIRSSSFSAMVRTHACATMRQRLPSTGQRTLGATPLPHFFADLVGCDDPPLLTPELLTEAPHSRHADNDAC